MSEGGDRRTVDLDVDADVDPEDAPLKPADPEGLEIEGGEVLGCVQVDSASRYGGLWGLSLSANFATGGLDAVTVDERLETGTYAVVRVDGDRDE